MKNVFLIFSFCILFILGCSSDSETNETNDRSDNNKNSVNIDKESAVDTYCYVEKIFETDKKYYITVDFIQFLTGEDAEIEAKKQGHEVYNDYVIANDDLKMRTFLVSEKTAIILMDYTNGIESVPNKKPIDLLNKNTSIGICILNVTDGEVTKLEEIYTP